MNSVLCFPIELSQQVRCPEQPHADSVLDAKRHAASLLQSCRELLQVRHASELSELRTKLWSSSSTLLSHQLIHFVDMFIHAIAGPSSAVKCRTCLSSVAAARTALTRRPLSRSFSHAAVLASGHNRWSKIRHKKGAADAQKSTIYSKITLVGRLCAESRRAVYLSERRG